MGNPIVKQAERIVSDNLQEQIKSSYQILGKGLVNQVCVVETENRKVVVRMNDQDSFPSYIKEKWCIEHAAAVGIPGPDVLSVGIDDKTAYMIQSHVDGDNGLDSKVHKTNVVWRQIGEYAKLVHSIPVSGYGDNLIDPVKGEYQSPAHAGSDGSWQGYVQYNINSLTEDDPLIKLGVITQAESQRVRKLFEKVKRETFRFGLNHGDISFKNIIINEDDQVFLLDWGNAEVFVVPHGDVINLMQYQILGLAEGPNMEEFKSFLDGYGISVEDTANMRPLLLLRAFDKLRWAIDKSPDLIDSYAAYARKVVQMTVD